MLLGRTVECARLDRMLAAALTGQSEVLVLHGEPGIGKTALLGYMARRAEGSRVVWAAGVESEMELPYAGLHQLCAPLLDGVDRLPPPQHDALATAFGLSAGARPDRFLVGLAVLSLLSDAAEESPLVCLVDDAHWLDRSSAQVLAFVARRLQAESVVLVFAQREPGERDELAGLPEMGLRGLSDPESRDLLASVISGPLDERVQDRILAEARGNPLALLELPRESSPARLAGGFGLPDESTLPSRIEARFRWRVKQLPTPTQSLLLIAAAEPTGDPAVLWRAATELGISTEAVGPAEANGLLEIGARVAFRHPLLRSAIYRGAPAEARRQAHRALSAATDREVDPDHHAWHRAHATLAPDEDVASELERSAGRARARGGLAAAAAFLSRAVVLTPGPVRRTRRALEAAAAEQLAGSPEAALVLLATAAAGPMSELERARVQRLHGQIALDLRRGGEAIALLLDAARRLESKEPDLARETYLEALRAASVGGRLGGGVHVAAAAARKAPQPTRPSQAIDLLLDGLAVRFTEGYAASTPALKHALQAVRDDDGRSGDVRWPWSARRVAPDLFDDDSWHALATRNVQIARDTGALAVLPLALNYLSGIRVFEGELDAAAVLLKEADAISEATKTAPILFGKLHLAACRGDQAEALSLIDASESEAIARGEGVLLTFGEHARALLHNSLGQYDSAVGPAQSASSRDELFVSIWSLPELVEAASRSGKRQLAATTLERLVDHTRAAATELALGIEARSRALLSDAETTEALYNEALARLSRCRLALELARAHLLYGEWLRRQNRRVDARRQLHTAHEMFASMGADAFAARAERELAATGETVRKRTVTMRGQLTAQEQQIAQLASAGSTNPEIAAQLFISPRTVQYHLHKVFTKLDISSRSQLDRVLLHATRGRQPV